MNDRLTLIILVLFVFVNPLLAQKDRYFSINYSRARAAGMGDAFTAVCGGLESVFYNPATVRLVNITKGIKLSFFVNPIIGIELLRLNQKTSKNNAWWDVLKTLPKAVILTSHSIELGFVNYEELATRELYHPHNRFFEGDNFLEHHFETAFLRISLAEQVHVGGAVQYYTTFQNGSVHHGSGISYGVYLRPNPKFNVGIVFVTLPQELERIRLNYNRFYRESLNVGIAFHPFRYSTLSIDIRNLSEDSTPTTREMHVGIEQGIFRQLFFRAGYFYDEQYARNQISAGIGLLDLNFLRLGTPEFNSPNLALNYALTVVYNSSIIKRLHFFSLQLGF